MARTRIARGLKKLVLLSALGLAIAGLSQCRMINDPVAGTDLSVPAQTADARSDCIRTCATEMKAAKRAEHERHQAALRACNESGQQGCKKAENRVHKQNQSRIQQDFKACKNACYSEGSGGGGR
jgi:hypothetical protein